MGDFLHDPIPETLTLVNAPGCRTRLEAVQYWLAHNLELFKEAEPRTDETDVILHEITHPYSNDRVINRRIVIVENKREGGGEHSPTVRKSVRHGLSNLAAEKRNLELVALQTTVPVPKVLEYSTSPEFEHLLMTKAPGATLDSVYDSLSVAERAKMADNVIAAVSKLRKLTSDEITAALLNRKPLPPGLKTVSDFNRHRFRHFLIDERVTRYVHERATLLDAEPNVFSHMDLDYTNIFVTEEDNKSNVSCFIDFEQSRFLPAYWEWVWLKAFSQHHPEGTWFRLLTERLEKLQTPAWAGMWEVEQLFQALDKYCFGWALEPQQRRAQREQAGREISRILGVESVDCVTLPLIDPGDMGKHAFWLEEKKE